MGARANTYQIRAGAHFFSSAAQGMTDQSKKLEQIAASFLTGHSAWKGQAAQEYQASMKSHEEDMRTASSAFARVSDVLNHLANQLDHVNSLRQQADQLEWQIRELEAALHGADDSRRPSISQEISFLSSRCYSLQAEADSLETQANQTAWREFDDIADLVNRLHVSSAISVDLLSPIDGPSKIVGMTGSVLDLKDGVNRYREGFGVEVVNGKNSRNGYAKVTRGSVEGIRGKKYYFSNAENYKQVMKYVDGNVAAAETLKDMDAWGTRLGYATIAYDTSKDVFTDIDKGESTSKVVADATVDVGVGVASMAASGWAGAEAGAFVGTFVGGPVGTLVGAGVGFVAGVAITYVTDGLKIHGKSLSDYAKDGLKSAIDEGTSLVKSAQHAFCDLF